MAVILVRQQCLDGTKTRDLGHLKADEKRAEYLGSLPPKMASTLFKARCHMLTIRANHGLKLPCRLCGAAEETQDHLVQTCTTLNGTREKYTVEAHDIYSSDLVRLKGVSAFLMEAMDSLNNIV